MGLSNVSAWFISPGHGALDASAQVIHAGRNTAVVRSLVRGDDGRTVLEAVTQHIAQARVTSCAAGS
jgi:acyl-coenzyme A thioesterase PaaI-like protein